MDNRTQIREFLASRRARLSPEQAGLPAYGGNRRVPGLRREEVAMLAGVSVDYYTRLERGGLNGASDSVLDSLARALQLDEAETAHLFHLARTAGEKPVRRKPSKIRPSVQRILAGLTGAPAWIRNGRSDILAINELGRALYAPVLEFPGEPPNTARFAFLDPRAREFFPNWDQTASDIVAVLRAEAGRSPYDKGLTDLVGELSTRSEEFRVRWASHDVRFHRTGIKVLDHPVVGRIELDYEAMTFPSDPDLLLVAYTPRPGTPSHDAMELLASWWATEKAKA